ncbi:hypothetical protein AB0N17_27770 [Streptomyces sp. NPDC051133]|uniref:hypothetical protein n=1 Tax=Streptomyces sp. NPDC051133 TaxID=3155521 RepID=UPI003416BCE9
MITGDGAPLPGWRGGDGNAAYLDKTLRHQHIEMALNESVDGKIIFRLWLRAAVISFLVYLVPGYIGCVLLLSGLGEWATSSSPSLGNDAEPPNSIGSATALLMFASLAAFAAFWVVLLVSRVAEPVGEWRVLLADRYERAETVYATIAGTLGTRGYPISPRSFGTRMTLSERSYTAYVSVFNYGSSLYLGWMMWRSRRGTELVGQFLGDLVRSFRGENGIEHQMLRSEGARAMREAVHLACREGLMVAIESVPQGPGHVRQPFPGHVPPPPVAPPTVSPVAPPTVSPGVGQFPEQPGRPQWGADAGHLNGE